ncbi:hypothetical protein EG328_009756 [Venturia inaequalis]|uniref:Peroxidase n=1 Tax=Venturia inaequalis TaxID=5025 RepID=A0A8H3Z551_VENIN|nr:hypothetical protein EG328_009756 [Venturia inaequalis]
MRVSTLIVSGAAVTSALDFQSVKRSFVDLITRKDGGSGSCPTVWTSVSAELTTKFLLKDGTCNDDARAAIRAIFHDCGAWSTELKLTNGCDGSLQFELLRGENGGLTPITTYLVGLAAKHKVGVADTINFAGTHAIVTCPGGPVVPALIGRTDATKAGVEGRLPDVNAPADDLFKLFQNKGYDAVDLAAILGAHSTSKQFGVDPAKAGQAQDSTPGVWDVKYYGETTSVPKDVFVFPSDAKLAVHPTVGKEFKGFVGDQGKWSGKFADAMARMATFGNDKSKLVDCTDALPKAVKVRRNLKEGPQ